MKTKMLANRKIVVSISFILGFLSIFLSDIVDYNNHKFWNCIANPIENMLWFMKYIAPQIGNIGMGLISLITILSYFILLSLMLTSSRAKIFFLGILLLIYYIGAQIYSLYENKFSDFFSMGFIAKIGMLIFFTFELYLILIAIYNAKSFYEKNI